LSRPPGPRRQRPPRPWQQEIRQHREGDARITRHKLQLVALVVLVAAAAHAEPWRFAMTCDSRGSRGINTTILTELVQEFLDRRVDLVLFPGDLTSGIRISSDDFENLLRQWLEIVQPLHDAGIAVYTGRGNHEIFDNYTQYPSTEEPNQTFAGRWLEVFGPNADPNHRLPDNGPPGEKYMTYAVTHKNAFFAVLDMYGGLNHYLAHDVNQPWLDRQLAANTKPHVFITAHEPAFKAKNRTGFDYYPQKRNAFVASILNNAGRIYMSGHDHFYNHARIDDHDADPDNDLHQFIVGTAGPLYTWDGIYPGNNAPYTVHSIYHARRNGYLLVEVNDLAVTTTWYQRHTTDTTVNGIYEPNDTWSYTAVPKPIILTPNGGQALSAQSNYTITWKTLEGAQINAVTLEYSTDLGATWYPIATTPNTGSFRWHLPPAESTDCLVRIASAQDPGIADTSDRPFTIYTCPHTLQHDLNHDCYLDFLDYVLLAADPDSTLADIAALARNWLHCANPFDPLCAPR